ncbi:LacI family DNA-binding transcriptional regulator [Microbacterium ulmi]
MTIRAVAAHAGVSRQTVSNALNAPQRLTAPTLARVRAAIDELGYVPDEAARALTSRRTRLIGIHIGPTAHSHASTPEPLLAEFVRAAARHGFRLVVLGSFGDDAGQIAAFDDVWRRRAVDGVILTDTHTDDARPAWLRERGVPFAAFGRPWGAPDSPHPWIDVDGHGGAWLAVDHLASSGHSRIAFLGWGHDEAGGDDRERGWLEAMTTRGLDARPHAHASGDTVVAGAERAAELLERWRPTAVVCASDTLAAGVVRAADRRGIAVGSDLAVTGYDDSPLARLTHPELTSLTQPFAAVADFLVDHVVMASGIEVPDPPPRTRVAEPTLVVRGSTGGVRAGALSF